MGFGGLLLEVDGSESVGGIVRIGVGRIDIFILNTKTFVHIIL